MPDLVPWRDLAPGMELYEEWRNGGPCVRCRVLRITSRGSIEMKFFGEYREWTESRLPDRAFRYWRHDPTNQERAETAWEK